MIQYLQLNLHITPMNPRKSEIREQTWQKNSQNYNSRLESLNRLSTFDDMISFFIDLASEDKKTLEKIDAKILAEYMKSILELDSPILELVYLKYIFKRLESELIYDKKIDSLTISLLKEWKELFWKWKVTSLTANVSEKLTVIEWSETKIDNPEIINDLYIRFCHLDAHSKNYIDFFIELAKQDLSLQKTVKEKIDKVIKNRFTEFIQDCFEVYSKFSFDEAIAIKAVLTRIQVELIRDFKISALTLKLLKEYKKRYIVEANIAAKREIEWM